MFFFSSAVSGWALKITETRLGFEEAGTTTSSIAPGREDALLPERLSADETAAARIAVFQRALLSSELVPQPRGPEMGEVVPLLISALSSGMDDGASPMVPGSGVFGGRREKARLRPSPTDLLLLTTGGGASPPAAEPRGTSTAEMELAGTDGWKSVFTRKPVRTGVPVDDRGSGSSNLESAATRSFCAREAVLGRICDLDKDRSTSKSVGEVDLDNGDEGPDLLPNCETISSGRMTEKSSRRNENADPERAYGDVGLCSACTDRSELELLRDGGYEVASFSVTGGGTGLDFNGVPPFGRDDMVAARSIILGLPGPNGGFRAVGERLHTGLSGLVDSSGEVVALVGALLIVGDGLVSIVKAVLLVTFVETESCLSVRS